MNLPIPLLLSLGIGVIALIVVLPVVIRTVKGKRKSDLWHFSREGHAEFISGSNLADLVIFKPGGFVVWPESVIDWRYGRTVNDRLPHDWRRKTRPVTLNRAGDSGPLEFLPDGTITMRPLTRREADRRESMAEEIAVAEAAIRANAGDFVAKLLGAAAAILAIGVIGMVAAVVVKGDVF